MTLEKVEALPPIQKTGSGRNSDIFTQEVYDFLRTDPDTWMIVHKSDWFPPETDNAVIKKNRLLIYMKGRYAAKNNSDIETTVRTEVSNNSKRIVLYARSKKQ